MVECFFMKSRNENDRRTPPQHTLWKPSKPVLVGAGVGVIAAAGIGGYVAWEASAPQPTNTPAKPATRRPIESFGLPTLPIIVQTPTREVRPTSIPEVKTDEQFVAEQIARFGIVKDENFTRVMRILKNSWNTPPATDKEADQRLKELLSIISSAKTPQINIITKTAQNDNISILVPPDAIARQTLQPGQGTSYSIQVMNGQLTPILHVSRERMQNSSLKNPIFAMAELAARVASINYYLNHPTVKNLSTPEQKQRRIEEMILDIFGQPTIQRIIAEHSARYTTYLGYLGATGDVKPTDTNEENYLHNLREALQCGLSDNPCTRHLLRLPRSNSSA